MTKQTIKVTVSKNVWGFKVEIKYLLNNKKPQIVIQGFYAISVIFCAIIKF